MILSVAVALLVFGHSVIQGVRFATGDDFLLGLVPLTSIGSDGNVPTYYSALAILLCTGLLAAIGEGVRRAGERDAGYWYGLAAIFAFLSVDEMLALHEHLIEPVRNMLETSGAFFYAWIIPYGIGVLLIGAIYLRFLLRLPSRTMWLFIVAGALFVGGAIGIEMLGGIQAESAGKDNVTYVVLQTIEESMEMAGIVVFVYALADFIQQRFGSLSLRIVAAS